MKETKASVDTKAMETGVGVDTNTIETDTGLDIREGSLGEKGSSVGNGLEIGQYGFFAPAVENRYELAAEKTKEGQAELREKPFTAEFPHGESSVAGAERVQVLGLFGTAPEYSRGLYDEVGSDGAGLEPVAVLVVAACAVAFFAARGLNTLQRKRAERCTSQSR
jgi:hypothetical protein